MKKVLNAYFSHEGEACMRKRLKLLGFPIFPING